MTELYSVEIWTLFVETDSVTALPDGSGVRDVLTTGASPSGCSVMAKMTAVMGAMSYRRTVPSVMKLGTSAVQTTDAFLSKYFIYGFCGTYTNLKYVNVEGEVGTVQLYILVSVWSKLHNASYCPVGCDSRLPTWQRILLLLLLSSGLIQEFSHFHSCYQSHLPTNAAMIILNIKLFNIFVHSELCL